MNRFDTLSSIEQRFREEAAPVLSSQSVRFPDNEPLTLDIEVFSPNRSGYYYSVAHPKKRIVLHFTAGNTRSDMLSLTQQGRHVSVPFVIARDGTIYNLFTSKYWSGHLGEGIGNAKGTGNPQDKATIGIEISNYGYLVPRDGNLETIYSRVRNPQTGKTGPADIFCSLNQTEAYQQLTDPYRGQSYYASFTPRQIDSLVILLRFLTARYGIPREFLPEDKRFTATPDVLQFSGIVTHANYRPGGKWDIGPAFDWDTLIAGVKAPQYITPFPRSRGTLTVAGDEDSLEALFARSPGTAAAEEEEVPEHGSYNPGDFEVQPVDGPSSGNAPRLHALLTGINEYDRIRRLDGCLNDITAMERYLRLHFKDPAILKLTEKDATRQAITGAFRSHLSQAKAGDTVLFYFSGHGAREKADPSIWKEETDGSLECLVCYDGGVESPSGFLLTDKELRYLIRELHLATGAHILVIPDCCHAGDNTRNGGLMAADGRNIRRVFDKNGDFFPRRDWQDFIFAGEITEAEASAAGTTTGFLPEGEHLQIAACESDQVALEIAREGVFTKTLLQTLYDSGGRLSYRELHSRLRGYMRGVYEQTPRMYIVGDHHKWLPQGFLGLPPGREDFVSEAIFNNRLGWLLPMGAIHGVDASTGVTVPDISSGRQKTVYPRPGGIFADHTLLDGLAAPVDDEPVVLKAEVGPLAIRPLALEICNHDATPDEVSRLTGELIRDAGGMIVFSEAPEADYSLHFRGGEAFLTLPGDPYRPLIRPINYLENDSRVIAEQLRHISRWHFIKNLQNQAGTFPQQPLGVEFTRVYADNRSEPVDLSGDNAALSYERIGADWRGTVQIRVTNTTERDLYVCAAYLSREFECYLDFLPGRVHLLQKGASILLAPHGKDRISLKLENVEKEYNWEKSNEYLRFIISTELFDAEALTLGPLEQPLVLADQSRDFRTVQPKGFVTEEEEKGIQFSGWHTQGIGLTFTNPVYNRIPARTLQGLLEWEETAYFATGLYCDIAPDEYGQPTVWKLKPELVIPEDEKGLFGNIVMWLGNQIETAQRRKRYRNLKKDPSRIRIVAEGDSWFQYPIRLQDTIDQLYKRYAICSFAEAGDTLENYLKKREYVEAIRSEGARFFIVSGGGNDIIGEELKDLLTHPPHPGTPGPGRYLNAAFDKQLIKLKDLYDQMFTDLLSRYPALHILVHCYDYVLPLDTALPENKKKSSWCGKHMIKAGVAPQSEREALIRYMIDAFANQLSTLIDQKFQGKVTLVDTRRTISPGNWYDEIHPTDGGYALVADKFIRAIEAVKASHGG